MRRAVPSAPEMGDRHPRKEDPVEDQDSGPSTDRASARHPNRPPGAALGADSGAAHPPTPCRVVEHNVQKVVARSRALRRAAAREMRPERPPNSYGSAMEKVWAAIRYLRSRIGRIPSPRNGPTRARTRTSRVKVPPEIAS